MRIAALVLAAALSLRAGEVPATLVSEDEVEPIHSAIVRKEAWTQDAVRRLRADAERHLKEGPWSITYNRPIGTELDPHEYYSEAAYWWPNPSDPAGPYIRREGEINPARFTANHAALVALCDSVFTLGTAGFLLEDPRYSRRAAHLVHTWFLDPKTRMNPNLEYALAVPGLNNGHGTGIIEGRAFIGAIEGMELLAQTGEWDARDRAAVRKWFEEYLRWLIESRDGIEERRGGNTQASWWAAQVAAVATFVGDSSSARMAFEYYREHLLPLQFPAGRGAAGEEARLRPLGYHLFDLEALALICRISQVQGVDLWDARTPAGNGIAAAIDHLETHLAGQHAHAREPGAISPVDGPYALAFAGMGLKRPEYIALFRKLDHSDTAWTTLIDLLVGRWEASAHQTLH